MQTSIAAHSWGCCSLSLSVPRTLPSVFITLQINQSSSYISMASYIDLIEHIVGKVLRNPRGALFLSSQHPLIALLQPSSLCITSSRCLFLLFLLSFFPPLTPNYLFSSLPFLSPFSLLTASPPLYVPSVMLDFGQSSVH